VFETQKPQGAIESKVHSATERQRTMLKTIRWTASALIVLLALAWAVTWVGDLHPTASIGGPFTLTDTAGRRVTDTNFRGKWMIVYFGYAYCPDICPTELQAIATAMDLLGPRADAVVPIFITIDPARDTPAALGQYVKLFDDRIVGLTGSAEDIAAVTHAYRVSYARVDGTKSTSYIMDHTSSIFLMAPDGKFRAMLPQNEDPNAMVGALRMEMTKRG